MTLRVRFAGARTRKRSRHRAQFAEDLMRLRRDRRNYQQVASWMERINLVRSERARELSRVNKSLYEFLHPDEGAARRTIQSAPTW